MRDPYEIVMLNAGSVWFGRSEGGVLQAVIDGVEYPEVLLYRSYPFSRPMEYISVRTPKEEEIGLIRELEELEAGSREEAVRELNLRYLIPRVTHIESIAQKPALWIWKVETTLGAMTLALRNLHEHLQSPASGRYLITDIEGRRCEIESVEALDSHSRKQWNKIL
ncbi:DUF1854 domain-containing protein [Paenibacillus doosanensis]|uniref:DUF1854 domain-containing protein n=1 Tax=Paenibacillus konkukensis TaxID=2020716 RepID=A0ABY4RJI6_9BACL|nr:MULTISPECIES: DUF1854 domain-containing protein [Paenibacillus]MCS7459797.1 DUF1854 domain-containing protein [Paenibacillus doosanensis]UQZ81784.1 hypothetical protein SK3146_00940 [Paenibacillus konkukensis]